MEDPSMEWSIQEYPSEGRSSSSKACWILSKGLNVGKKILVTGFVISSVPVVLPPLLVVSAIGFAFSVPYGVFLATYACTESVMSKLLPKPTPALIDYRDEISEEECCGDGEIDEEDEYMEFGVDIIMVNDVEEQAEETKIDLESRIELVDEEDELGQGKISRVDHYVQIDVPNDKEQPLTYVEEFVEENEVAIVGDEESTNKVEVMEVPIEVTTLTLEEDGVQERMIGIKGIKEELVGEKPSLLKRIRDEGIADTAGTKERQPHEELHMQATDMPVKEVVISDVVLEKPMGKDEEITQEKSIREIEIGDKVMGEAEPITDANTNPADMKEIVENGSVLKGENADKPIGSTLQTSLEKDATNSVDRPVSSRKAVSEDTGLSSEKDTSVSSIEVQVIHTEKQVWEQIEGLRRIVGYKAAPQSTCVEELKALYIFTGIEPPASFNDPSDLSDVNDKLRFLMAIVGVI